MFETLTAIDPDAEEAALIERIAELERLKSAAAAGQARAAAAVDAARRAAEGAAGVPAARRGRGLASEIALARRDSPARGSRHLGFAKALVYEMPHTLAALDCGALSEWRATLIVRESACLDVADRRALDAELCGDPGDLEGMGDARVVAAARAIAYRLDPQAVVDRAANAENDRTVTIRPAPDTMTYLTALLPVAQGVSVYAALTRAADTRCDGRSRGQVMADTLVERVTGRDAAVPTPIAVNLVMSDETLLGAANTPAQLCGYGPIPAAVARTMVASAVTDQRSRATLRRLYAHPQAGALVSMESRARLFPRGLAAFIELRDQRCRTPYCDAPIRHRDHAHPWADGGPTPTSHVDLVPTLLSAAGVDVDVVAAALAESFSEVHPLPGRDLMPVVDGASADEGRAIYLMTRDNVLEGDTGASLLSRQLGRIVNPPAPLRIKVPAHVAANFEGLVVRVDDTDAAGGAGHLWKLVRTFDDPATWTEPGVRHLATNGMGGDAYRTDPLDDQWELYDLTADPIEAYNRWTDPQLHELRQHLRMLLKQQRAVSVPERNQPWPYAHRLPPSGASNGLVRRVLGRFVR